jgi:serine/threonine protein kinase
MASFEFHRDYLTELPLPLAQLYRRTNDEKSDEARHNTCYFLFEALVKLIAAPAIALYLEDVGRDPSARVDQLDQQLQALACPSQGHWVGILRELARHFAKRPDAEVHPLGHLWNELEARRRDSFDGLVELYRAIKDGPDSAPSGDQSCCLRQVVEALVRYRNLVLGHGAHRSRSFYEGKAPLFVPAVNDVLQSTLIRKLWPENARLIYVEELRTVGVDQVEMEYKELTGEHGVRMQERRLTKAQADRIVVKRVALTWPNRDIPLRLDPLLIYHDKETVDEVLFLNKDDRGKRVEHLSYRTGVTYRDRDEMALEMRHLMERVRGRNVSASDFDRLVEQSQAGVPLREYVSHEPPKGRVMDDFEILVRLGKGGMGVVFLARQLSLGRLVALKMLPPALAGNELYLTRFQREIRILSQCEHPNMVKILAHGVTDNEGPYFAMEYVPGCDLNELGNALAADGDRPISSLTSGTVLRSVWQASRKKRELAGVNSTSSATLPISDSAVPGAALARVDSAEAKAAAASTLPPLPEPLVVVDEEPHGYVKTMAAIIRDAARALQYIHDRDVIHRDVKPANLMISPDMSRVVLMDFGLARVSDSDLTEEWQRNKLGTLRYMAPEQLQVRDIDCRVDVRALGITLWELLARQRIFAGVEDDEQLRSAILDQDLPRLRSVDKSIPIDLEAIVACATERRPSDRIVSAAKLADYLDDFIEGRELTIRRRSGMEKALRLAREHPWASSLASGLLLAVIGWAVTFTILRGIALAAEANARDAVNEFFVEASENDLLNQPGLKAVRRQLLLKAKGYYAQFLRASGRSKQLLLEIAKTQYRMGVITQDLESHEAAVFYFRDSLKLLENIGRSEERDLFRSFAMNRLGQTSQEAAEASRDAMEAAAKRGDRSAAGTHYTEALTCMTQAKEYFGKALDMRRQLLTQRHDAEYARLLANSLMNLGQLTVDEIDFKRAWSQIGGTSPQDDAPRFDNELRDAENYFEEADKLQSEEIASVTASPQPDRPEDGKTAKDKGQPLLRLQQRLQRDQGMLQLNWGQLYAVWGRVSPAAANEKYQAMLAHAQLATGTFDELRQTNPADTQLRFFVAQALIQQASAALKLGQPTVAPLHRAESQLETLVGLNPQVALYRRELARTSLELATHFQSPLPVAALHHRARAHDQIKLVKNDFPDDFQKINEAFEEDLKTTDVRNEYAFHQFQLAATNLRIGDEPLAYPNVVDFLQQVRDLQPQLQPQQVRDSLLDLKQNLLEFWLQITPDRRYSALLEQTDAILNSIDRPPADE